MSKRNWLLSTSALAGAVTFTLTAWPVVAADIGSGPVPYEPPAAPPADGLPAVSGINLKVDGFGGWTENDAEYDGVSGGLYGVSGSLAVPVGERFGAQLDGMIAGLDGDLIGGAAGHFFWRDPSAGLIGAVGSWVTRDGSGIDVWRVGAEAEAYLGRVSLEGVVGYEGTDSSSGFSLDDSNIFGIADAAYYLTEDFRVSVGYRHLLETHIGAAGLEYQLPTESFGGISLFAEGRIGEDDYVGGWGGLRFAFGGGDKSLMRRHREDDPNNPLPNDLFDIDMRPGDVPDICDGIQEDCVCEVDGNCPVPIREP